jgi:hypothetical protein
LLFLEYLGHHVFRIRGNQVHPFLVEDERRVASSDASMSINSSGPDPPNDIFPLSEEIEIRQTPLASIDGVKIGAASVDVPISVPAVSA